MAESKCTEVLADAIGKLSRGIAVVKVGFPPPPSTTALSSPSRPAQYDRRGRPGARTLQLVVHPDGRLELLWHGRGHAVNAADVVEVVPGKQTPVLSRTRAKVQTDRCLSVLAPSRTLDLELSSQRLRDWLMHTLRLVVAHAKRARGSTTVP